MAGGDQGASSHSSSETRTARVIAVLPDDRVRVIVDESAICNACAAGRGCGLGLSTTDKTELVCDARGLELTVDSEVSISVSQSARAGLATVALAYGAPLVGLLLGMTGGSVLQLATASTAGVSADGAAALGGVLGVAGGVLAWTLLSARLTPRTSGPVVSDIRTGVQPHGAPLN